MLWPQVATRSYNVIFTIVLAVLGGFYCWTLSIHSNRSIFCNGSKIPTVVVATVHACGWQGIVNDIVLSIPQCLSCPYWGLWYKSTFVSTDSSAMHIPTKYRNQYFSSGSSPVLAQTTWKIEQGTQLFHLSVKYSKLLTMPSWTAVWACITYRTNSLFSNSPHQHWHTASHGTTAALHFRSDDKQLEKYYAYQIKINK